MNIQKKILVLHESSIRLCLVCTGAGAGCQNLLTQVPGASKTLLESYLPYSKEGLIDFLGFEPEHFASEKTALQMASRAWRRAVEIMVRRNESSVGATGVAVTGVIATNRPLRGDHRIFIAVRSVRGSFVTHVTFAKDAAGLSVLGRVTESGFSDILTLNAILESVGIEQVGIPNSPALSGDLNIGLTESTLRPRRIDRVSTVMTPISDQHVLFEGSFNPLHHGHEKVAKEVERMTGKKVVYVITDSHPDKGEIGTDVLQARLAQFDWIAPAITTKRLSLYVEKARAFPGFSFVIGADTLRRVLDSKYYKHCSVEDMLDDIMACNVHFYVASRRDGDKLITFDSLRFGIDSRFWPMFTQLTTVVDISSTAIRNPVS